MSISHIRNFAIIAHVDHGKSTLADRFLELTGLVKHAQSQTLDSNPIEKERGITIKLAPVTMHYQYQGQDYTLNLIDTPGHVDFSYEVNRALAACEGAILLVDATQGVQAQTLAHFRQAKSLNLKIIPVINKVDLPGADVEGVLMQMIEVLELTDLDVAHISAKSGQGVQDLLHRVVQQVPPPSSSSDITRALVFNSEYLHHQGVRAWVRVFDGVIPNNVSLTLLNSKQNTLSQEIGIYNLQSIPVSALQTGEVGYIITGLKDPHQVKIGDTLTLTQFAKQNISPLPGYKLPVPMVFVSLYPIDAGDFVNLTQALDRLTLSDSSLTYTEESSALLGHGYRIGFLGLLHAEIVQERLEREFNLTVIATTPTVTYKIVTKGQTEIIYSPNDLPEPGQFDSILEPMLRVTIFTPLDYMGPIMDLMRSKRAKHSTTHSLGKQVQLEFIMPLAEMVGEFYSRLKSISSGYASLDYELLDWQEANLSKLEILLAGEKISILSQIVPKDRLESTGRAIVDKLSQLIPRHQFEVAIQAVVGAKVIARSTVKPFRKDVTAKLYGGDQTRKDKLLKKQKKGKRKMKQLGKVSVMPDTFLKLMQ